MCILKFYCRTCQRNTNHGIISFEHSLPQGNFSTLQCLSCDTGSFSVMYEKGQEAPLFNSRRVSEILGDDEQNVSVCQEC